MQFLLFAVPCYHRTILEFASSACTFKQSIFFRDSRVALTQPVRACYFLNSPMGEVPYDLKKYRNVVRCQ